MSWHHNINQTGKKRQSSSLRWFANANKTETETEIPSLLSLSSFLVGCPSSQPFGPAGCRLLRQRPRGTGRGRSDIRGVHRFLFLDLAGPANQRLPLFIAAVDAAGLDTGSGGMQARHGGRFLDVENLADLANMVLGASTREFGLGDCGRRRGRGFHGKLGEDSVGVKMSTAGLGERKLVELVAQRRRLASGSWLTFREVWKRQLQGLVWCVKDRESRKFRAGNGSNGSVGSTKTTKGAGLIMVEASCLRDGWRPWRVGVEKLGMDRF